MKRPDYAGVQREKNGYSGFDDGYRGRGQCSQCDRHDYMDADRFGLSQLHQLRGRVGRGDKQSYAVLVANPKTDSGKDRMRIMTETTNGFVLAEEDLKMRGSGEIFGTRQSGLPEFQVADIIEDFPILEEARKVASYISSIEALARGSQSGA